MAESKTGYRAFPPEINHPSKAKIYSQNEFDNIEKQKLEEAPSFCAGHKKTIVWYAKSEGYIIQIQFDSKPDIYVNSICTFTPTMEMDKIDGEFAQDVEAYILDKELGCPSNRLDVFEGKESVEIMQYIESRGYSTKQQ